MRKDLLALIEMVNTGVSRKISFWEQGCPADMRRRSEN